MSKLPQCLFKASAAASSSFSGGALGTRPPCTGDAACVAVCYVSTGTTWVCKDNTGADTGSVVQGTTPTAESTFAPGMLARSNVSDTNAPTASGAAFDNLLAGDMTMVAAGIWHANGSTANSAYATIGHASTLTQLFGAFAATGTPTCYWTEGGVTVNALGTGAIAEGWAVVSCRRSGNDRIARANGTDGTTVSTAGTRSAGSGMTVSFGRERPGATGRNLAGPLAWVAFYSESKSATWLRGVENAFWGVGLDAGFGNSGMVGISNDAGTDVDFFAGGAHVVSPDRGLRTVGQSGANIDNNWAADPFDVNSWVNVGTPTITSNVTSGPFARWKQTAECDRMVDDDAVAFEGKESLELQRTTAAGTPHAWNMRVWARSGDTGVTTTKMRISITTDGTGSTNCDFTSLTATPQAFDCPAFVGGSPTTVKGRVLVGTATSDTGSVIICHAQDTPFIYPQLAVTNSTAFGSGFEALDPTSWPSTAKKGKYEVVFTPLNDISGASWDNGGSIIYLFDAFNATPVHSVVMIGGYQAAGRFMARITDAGGNVTEFLVDGTTLTPGQRYAASMEWRPAGPNRCKVWFRLNSCPGDAAGCRATVVLAKAIDGSGRCPAQPTGVRLGDRYDSTVPSSVFIDAVRVYQ